MSKQTIYLISFVLVLSLVGNAGGQTGQIMIEWWTNISGGNLTNLLNHADYPDNPAGSDYLSIFEIPNTTDNAPPGLPDLTNEYGARIRGYFHPPATGEYTFWIISDDESQLFLSPEGGSSHAVPIARCIRSTPFTNWTRYAGQQSKPIMLEAGKKYYIEAIYKDGTGGDRLRVAYGAEGAQTVIPGSELSPWDPGIATNPSPADGGENTQFWVGLGWSAGPDAVEHDVYLGDNYTEVEAGTGDTFRGRQTSNTILVGFSNSPYPDGLTPGVTYYWRVDEVEADGTTIHTGELWSFTVLPPPASNPDPADNARFVDPDVELSWSQGYGAIMHHVYFGDNLADVDAGTGDTDKGLAPGTTFTPGPLTKGTTYYWRIDAFDNITTHKGDIWRFRTEPTMPIYDPNLVGWWKLDDEGTGTLIDYSGYGHNGTIHGNPMWVYGADGDALEFYDRTDDEYVTIDGYLGVLGTHAFSITAWIRTRDGGEIVGWGNPSNGQRVEFRTESDRLRCENGGGGRNVQGDTLVDDDEWHHVAVTVIEGATPTYPGEVIIYLDGEDDTRESTNGTAFNTVAQHPVTIARRYNTAARWYWGAIDDVRIYDKVLTAEEINEIMLRPDPYPAWGPGPADTATPDIEHVKPLAWSPGQLAAKHDIYLGTDEFAVDTADTSDTTGIYRDRLDLGNESYTPPEAFEFDQTFYWRIDEYNTDETITKGKVWSFTVADYLVVDDFEDYNDWPPDEIWSTWIDGYGVPANGSTIGYPNPDWYQGEHYVETTIVHDGDQAMPYFYDNGFKYSEAERTLSPPQDWTRRGVRALTLWFRGYPGSSSTFTEGPVGTYTMTARSADIFDESDHFNYVYKQLSGAGSIVVKVESITNTSNSAKAGVMIRETLDPGSKHAFTFMRPDGGVRFNRRIEVLGETYNSVENGLALPHWVKLERGGGSGQLTAYHSTDGITWVPVDDQNMGSLDTVLMNNVVYIGLALSSNNTGATCEAKFSNVSTTGSVTGQWQSQDIGIPSNVPEPMYVAVANSTGPAAVVYHDDPNATQIDTWTEWNIDLKEFADQGVNLTNVSKLAIGFGDKNNPGPGTSGTMFFDDIRLYPPRCVPDIVKPAGDFSNDCVVDILDLEIMSNNWLISDYEVTPVAASDANLVAYYKFDGNANDSSGNGNHGDPNGGPVYTTGIDNQAISLDNIDDYVAIQNLHYDSNGHPEVSVCAWIRTSSEENQAIVSFDRNEYWRFEINGEGAGPGEIGLKVMTSTGQMDYGSSSRVDDGQWHHVAGVFDNGTLSFYIDGNREQLALGGSTFGTGTTRYGFVGSRSEADVFDGDTGTPWHFNGDLDDVRIYSRALSQAEVADLAGKTAAFTQPLYLLLTPQDPAINMNNDRTINFKDFALLADTWLEEQLWPQ